MVSLEKLVEETDPKMVSNNSWLRHLVPHSSLPAVLMQNGVKVLTNGGKGPAHQHGRLVLPATTDTECRQMQEAKDSLPARLLWQRGALFAWALFVLELRTLSREVQQSI